MSASYNNSPEAEDKEIQQSTVSNEYEIPQSNRKRLNVEDQNLIDKYESHARRKIENGDIDKGIQYYEAALEKLVAIEENGAKSPIFQNFIESTVTYLNHFALTLLQSDKLRDAFQLLEICSKWSESERYGVYPALISLTYNHFGCCYRRMGKLDQALYFLEMAANYLKNLTRVDISGMTYINLCATLSQSGE